MTSQHVLHIWHFLCDKHYFLSIIDQPTLFNHENKGIEGQIAPFCGMITLSTKELCSNNKEVKKRIQSNV